MSDAARRDIRVGDRVRVACAVPEDEGRTTLGYRTHTVTAIDRSGIELAGHGRWYSTWTGPGSFFQLVQEAPPSFDPHALAMALQLAGILNKLGRKGDPDDLSLPALGLSCPNACHQCTADWLITEVQRELESQS